MKDLLIIGIFISVFSLFGCDKAEKILKTEKYFNFYVDYKTELFRKNGKTNIDVDSLLRLHKITSREMEIVKEGVRKNPKIWYTFSQDLVKYLDSTINVEDSITKAKRDSIKMTQFRFRDPELYKKARDLKRKNEQLIDKRYKILGKKRPKSNRKTSPNRYNTGKPAVRKGKKVEQNSKTRG